MLDGLMGHFRHLEKILRRRGRSREDAEDLIQESFLRVKMYLDEGHEIREPEAFLVRTALNLERDTRLREHRNLYSNKTLEELALTDTSATPDEVLQAEQRLRQLSIALNKAGTYAKEVFTMHRVHGMTYTQIGAHFGISQSAIEKHMARALAVLGDELNKS